jgi:hypothetical protein
MRDKAASRAFHTKKKLDHLLEGTLPGVYLPLYTMINLTPIPLRRSRPTRTAPGPHRQCGPRRNSGVVVDATVLVHCRSDRTLVSVWVIHVFGGVRAIYEESGAIKVHPDLLSGGTLEIPTASYREIVRNVKALNLSVVGIESLVHSWELNRVIPPNWRPFHELNSAPYVLFETGDKWSDIGHAAHKRRVGKLWDIAARISYQIKTCAWRLFEISEGYAQQLWSLKVRDKFEEGSRFDDLRTRTVYLAIQALLIDACVLRDYLAEFAAGYIYASAPSGVRTVSNLKKYLFSKPELADPLSIELRHATDKNGWLSELGHYRDLVVHSAPLATAKERLWVLCSAHNLPNGAKLPALRFPLPNDPAAIRSARSRGDLFEDFAKLIHDFVDATRPDVTSKDALQYLHTVLGKLGEIAAKFSTFSPLPPEMPVLTDADIIGPIRWDTPDA